MSQGSSSVAPRSWAVRLLLALMLAVCALLLHSPSGAPAAMPAGGHSASGSTSAQADHGSTLAQADQQALFDQSVDQNTATTTTAAETAIVLPTVAAAHNQPSDQRGDRCSCCPTPLDIAVVCTTVNTGPPQHGTLPRALAADASVTPDLVLSGRAGQRAAPPLSLAELSLLRV